MRTIFAASAFAVTALLIVATTARAQPAWSLVCHNPDGNKQLLTVHGGRVTWDDGSSYALQHRKSDSSLSWNNERGMITRLAPPSSLYWYINGQWIRWDGICCRVPPERISQWRLFYCP